MIIIVLHNQFTKVQVVLNLRLKDLFQFAWNAFPKTQIKTAVRWEYVTKSNFKAF